jgi:hypothetical protein
MKTVTTLKHIRNYQQSAREFDAVITKNRDCQFVSYLRHYFKDYDEIWYYMVYPKGKGKR